MKKILFLEESRGLNEGLTELLSAAGYQVDAVYDGVQALNYLKEREYDILLAEEEAPRLNLVDVLSRSGKRIKTVALTSRHRFLRKESGFDKVIEKPFSGEEILDSIKEMGE